MYPLIRMAKEAAKFRRAPGLGFFDTHVSHHRCWPQDIDVWMELNNGRTLTLYDLGRFALFQRTGVTRLLRARGWGATVAGSSIRYRRRVGVFDRVEMRSRAIGWDERFFYLEQSMWKDGICTSHVLMRSAVVGPEGMVPVPEAARALGQGESPPLPDWVRAWIAADAERPWPPPDAPCAAAPAGA